MRKCEGEEPCQHNYKTGGGGEAEHKGSDTSGKTGEPRVEASVFERH